MLMVIDVGNSQTLLGVYDGETLIKYWRITTTKERTYDEFGIMIRDLFHFSNISPENINDIIISCVVPPVLAPLLDMSKKYFDVEPMFVNHKTNTGMPILYDNPEEVGADRIVNSVAAYEKYKRSLIVVDFGTATTFDYISEGGEYMGGAIAPGIIISIEALSREASKLPKIDLIQPPSIIGKNTINSMQSGIIFGYIGLVDGIVNRMKEEIKATGTKNQEPYVVATGGLVNLIAHESKTIQDVDEYMTIMGLRIIYERNAAA